MGIRGNINIYNLIKYIINIYKKVHIGECKPVGSINLVTLLKYYKYPCTLYLQLNDSF